MPRFEFTLRTTQIDKAEIDAPDLASAVRLAAAGEYDQFHEGAEVLAETLVAVTGDTETLTVADGTTLADLDRILNAFQGAVA